MNCQKLGIILVIKWSKNVNNKKCAPKLVQFFNEKKNEKIKMIFGIENWLWSQLCALFDTSPLHQFSKFYNFPWVCWFLGKHLYLPLENSTTLITITVSRGDNVFQNINFRKRLGGKTWSTMSKWPSAQWCVFTRTYFFSLL